MMLYDSFHWFRRPLPPNVGELPETGLMVISNSGVIAVRVKFIKLFLPVVFRCQELTQLPFPKRY